MGAVRLEEAQKHRQEAEALKKYTKETNNPEPFSYTHLDVYKRQKFIYIKVGKLPSLSNFYALLTCTEIQNKV